MDANGSDRRKLAAVSGVDRDPAWSPDGGRVAFAGITEGTNAYNI